MLKNKKRHLWENTGHEKEKSEDKHFLYTLYLYITVGLKTCRNLGNYRIGTLNLRGRRITIEVISIQVIYKINNSIQIPDLTSMEYRLKWSLTINKQTNIFL